MARALGDDLQLRVLKAHADGLSARQAGARFGVGVSSAIRWVARAKLGGHTARRRVAVAVRASTPMRPISSAADL